MKTICVKVKLTKDQEQQFEEIIKELEWIWNYSLRTYLHNHCTKWYEWATNTNNKVTKALAEIDKLPPKQKEFAQAYFLGHTSTNPSKLEQSVQKKITENKTYKILELWNAFDLEGIRKVPLRFSDKSAYIGAACVIAEGGPYWSLVDTVDTKETKEVNNSNSTESETEVRRKKWKLCSGGKPYTPLFINPHSYPLVPSGEYKDREIIDWTDLVVKAVLSSVRESQGLPPLNIHSNYINGLVSQNGSLQKSWSAFLDTTRQQSKKPKFKNEDYRLNTLLNLYPPVVSDADSEETWIEVRQLGKLEVIDRNWRKRLGGDALRSHCVTKKRSGYYVHITTEHPLHSEKTVLIKQLAKAKKENGIESPEYTDIALKIADLDSTIRSSKTKPKKKELSIGIDPGIVSVIATDQGDLYTPNLSRERITMHIEQLQHKLKRMQTVNNALWKQNNLYSLESGEAIDITQKRPKTANELKLEHKIARLHERGASSARHFNHKLSSRIARTYKHVVWEDTKLENLLRQCKAKPDMSGIGYLPNGAASKRGLNWLLKQRCLGDLKERTKQKVLEYGGTWHDSPPKYSSQICHCCGYKEPLQRDGQNFTCKNEACSLYGIPQNADVNAARNHKKSIFELGEIKYNNLSLQYNISARKKHRNRKKQKPIVTVIKLSAGNSATSENLNNSQVSHVQSTKSSQVNPETIKH